MYGGGRVRRVLMTLRGKCSDRGSTPRASTNYHSCLGMYLCSSTTQSGGPIATSHQIPTAATISAPAAMNMPTNIHFINWC